jgi:hypothetical protein
MKLGTFVRMALLLVTLMWGGGVMAQDITVIHYSTKGIVDPDMTSNVGGLIYTEKTEVPTVSVYQEKWRLAPNGSSWLSPELVPVDYTFGKWMSETVSTPYFPTIAQPVYASGWFACHIRFLGENDGTLPLKFYGSVIVQMNFTQPYKNALSSPNGLDITPFGVVVGGTLKTRFAPLFVPRGVREARFKITITPYGFTVQ